MDEVGMESIENGIGYDGSKSIFEKNFDNFKDEFIGEFSDVDI